VIIEAKSDREITEKARFYRDNVFVAMSELRLISDELETITAKKYWTLPTYGEILFSVI
jgi:glutamine synthetase